MEVKEKNNLINNLLECIGEAIDLDSDDSEKEYILYGLTDLCKKATYLPTNKVKKQWIKPWRKARLEKGSFLTTELLLSDEASYRNYLGMSRTQFQFLLNLVQQDIKRCDTQMRIAITPAEKLAITLRYLATGDCFRSLEYQTQVSKSAISRIVPEVCQAIWKRMKRAYLKFPSHPLEWEAIATEFAVKWQFPNCLGALDEKPIHFRPLRKDGTNSIILMSLVDANCKFIYLNIGTYDNNDASVFLQSRLKTVLEEAQEIPPNNVVGNGRCLPYVVVGDDAFPMQTHLMKPYPYHTNCREEQIFNARLSCARHVVAHAFGILSNRFRVLLSPINLKVETVKTITFACCVLHNFLLENDDSYINSTEDSPAETNDNLVSIYESQEDEAEFIRQQFMAYFNNEGRVDWA